MDFTTLLFIGGAAVLLLKPKALSGILGGSRQAQAAGGTPGGPTTAPIGGPVTQPLGGGTNINGTTPLNPGPPPQQNGGGGFNWGGIVKGGTDLIGGIVGAAMGRGENSGSSTPPPQLQPDGTVSSGDGELGTFPGEIDQTNQGTYQANNAAWSPLTGYQGNGTVDQGPGTVDEWNSTPAGWSPPAADSSSPAPSPDSNFTDPNNW